MTRAPRRALLPLRAFLVLTALAVAASSLAAPTGAAANDEPPALPPAPAPEATLHSLREYAIESSIQETWSLMGDWKNGLADLENRSRAAGLTITSSTNPAYTTSFDLCALMAVGSRFFVGIQYDRPTGASRFSVRDAVGSGSYTFETSAEATSNAWLAVGRWMLPGARRGVRPLLQAGAGLGDAQLEFATPSGGAEGKGRAFVASIEAGLRVGDGPIRLRCDAGWRFHRVPLSYSRVRGASQPGVLRDYFDFDDETRAFVTGRDVDLSGAFVRVGASVVVQK